MAGAVQVWDASIRDLLCCLYDPGPPQCCAWLDRETSCRSPSGPNLPKAAVGQAVGCCNAQATPDTGCVAHLFTNTFLRLTDDVLRLAGAGLDRAISSENFLIAAASQHLFLTVVDLASLQLPYVPRLPDKCAAASMDATSPSHCGGSTADLTSVCILPPYHIQAGQLLGRTLG